MAKDHYVPEHKRYAQRLAELEAKSARAHQQKQVQPSKHISKKLPRLRWHHYKKNGERVLALVLTFGLILALMVYIISPLSKVKTVTVVGNNDLQTSQVEKATTIYPGRFMWGVMANKKNICRRARYRQPQINHVDVKITGPQSLQVTVRENALLGNATLGKQSYAVLANGHLQATNDKPVGIKYQNFTGHRQELQLLARQVGKLKPAIRNDISVINYQADKDAPNRVVMYMRDGNTVYANFRTVGKKMPFYPAIVANMKKNGVIDLQVGAYSYSYGSHNR